MRGGIARQPAHVKAKIAAGQPQKERHLGRVQCRFPVPVFVGNEISSSRRGMGSSPGGNRCREINFSISPKQGLLFGEVDRNTKGVRLVVGPDSHETSHDLDVFVFGCQPESIGLMLLGQFPRVRAGAEQALYERVIPERRREHEGGESLLT